MMIKTVRRFSVFLFILSVINNDVLKTIETFLNKIDKCYVIWGHGKYYFARGQKLSYTFLHENERLYTVLSEEELATIAKQIRQKLYKTKCIVYNNKV